MTKEKEKERNSNLKNSRYCLVWQLWSLFDLVHIIDNLKILLHVHFLSNKRLTRSLAYNSFCVLVYVINVHDCVLSQFSNGTRNNINDNYLIFKLFLFVIPDITPHTSMRIHRNQSMVTMMRSAQKHRKLIKSALFICLIRERNNASLKVFSARLPLSVANSLVCSFQILFFLSLLF